jgi:hypothetical protein
MLDEARMVLPGVQALLGTQSMREEIRRER